MERGRECARYFDVLCRVECAREHTGGRLSTQSTTITAVRARARVRARQSEEEKKEKEEREKREGAISTLLSRKMCRREPSDISSEERFPYLPAMRCCLSEPAFA